MAVFGNLEASMHTHKTRVTVPHSHRIEVDLPEDFPSGPADIIVLSSPPTGEAARAESSWTRFVDPHPVLGRITFHEDPSLPLESQDWPED